MRMNAKTAGDTEDRGPEERCEKQEAGGVEYSPGRHLQLGDGLYESLQDSDGRKTFCCFGWGLCEVDRAPVGESREDH